MSRHRDYEFDHEPYVIVERHDSGIGPLLLGIALGAGAALLFAPRSGVETRQIIKTRARDAGDAARARAEDLATAVTERVNEARDAVTERVGSVRDTVRRHRDELLDAFDAGRSAAHEARMELERKLAERKQTGPTRSGTARDGGARDGATRDGASRDGATRDGASRDGATRDVTRSTFDEQA